MSFIKIKKTPARVAITDFLYNSEVPVSIDEIIKNLRLSGLETNKVTVYRIVDYLLKNGALERLEFGEGKYRYEIRKGHHHHLICQKCGRIQDVEGDFIQEVEDKIYKTKSFIVKRHTLEFFGICKNCQS